jgi:hypothetical protein
MSTTRSHNASVLDPIAISVSVARSAIPCSAAGRAVPGDLRLEIGVLNTGQLERTRRLLAVAQSPFQQPVAAQRPPDRRRAAAHLGRDRVRRGALLDTLAQPRPVVQLGVLRHGAKDSSTVGEPSVQLKGAHS